MRMPKYWIVLAVLAVPFVEGCKPPKGPPGDVSSTGRGEVSDPAGDALQGSDEPSKNQPDVPEEKIRGTIREVVSLQLGVAEGQINDDVPLSQPPLAADDLDMVELIMELEVEFDISIPDRMIAIDGVSTKPLSVDDLVGIVRRRLAEEHPGAAAAGALQPAEPATKPEESADTGAEASEKGSEAGRNEADGMSGKYRRLRVSKVGEVIVARPVDAKLLDDQLVKELGEELFGLIEEEGPPKLLVDCAGVEFFSEAALGKLITLHMKVKAESGQLKLCGLRPEILEVFKITRLDQLFEIHQDRAAGLEAF